MAALGEPVRLERGEAAAGPWGGPAGGWGRSLGSALAQRPARASLGAQFASVGVPASRGAGSFLSGWGAPRV